jgi:hypothetical protein
MQMVARRTCGMLAALGWRSVFAQDADADAGTAAPQSAEAIPARVIARRTDMQSVNRQNGALT